MQLAAWWVGWFQEGLAMGHRAEEKAEGGDFLSSHLLAWHWVGQKCDPRERTAEVWGPLHLSLPGLCSLGWGMNRDLEQTGLCQPLSGLPELDRVIQQMEPAGVHCTLQGSLVGLGAVGNPPSTLTKAKSRYNRKHRWPSD